MDVEVKESPEQIAERKAKLAEYRAMTGADLATEVLALIEDNQERWYQGNWRMDQSIDGVNVAPCSNGATEHVVELYADDPLNPACETSFCFAGWVAAVKGVKWAKGNQELVGDPDKCDCKTLCCEVPEHQIFVSVYASNQLGIDSYEGDALFCGDNSIYALERGVEAIRDGESVREYIDGDNDGEDDVDY